jgi:6-phosphogluconolactonase
MSDGLRGTLRVAGDAGEVAADASRWLAEASRHKRTRPNTFSIALTGGSTPRGLYDMLAGPACREAIEWTAWEVFFSDERACPPSDPQSNFHLADDTLLSHVDIDASRIHRMRAESPDLDAAATEYSQLMAATLPAGPQGAPRLDAVLLGLGENGHVASLFPGTPALEVTGAWASRGLADYQPFDRITLTFPAINAAASIAVLVVGARKGEALRATVAGTAPAARVHPLDGELLWFLDESAARELP